MALMGGCLSQYRLRVSWFSVGVGFELVLIGWM